MFKSTRTLGFLNCTKFPVFIFISLFLVEKMGLSWKKWVEPADFANLRFSRGYHQDVNNESVNITKKKKILTGLVIFCRFFMKKVKILPGLVMCAWLFLVKRHFCITNSWLLAWLLGFFLKKMAMAFGPFSSKCHGF